MFDCRRGNIKAGNAPVCLELLNRNADVPLAAESSVVLINCELQNTSRTMSNTFS